MGGLVDLHSSIPDLAIAPDLAMGPDSAMAPAGPSTHALLHAAPPAEPGPHPVELILGHRFTNKAMLDQALRHASVTDARVKSNERLEFLGDAVLGLIVCQRTFEKFPSLLEGEMTKIKSAVVSRLTCAQIGKELGLEGHLTIGKGMRGHEVLPQSLAAAAVEALVAAVFLDGGLDAARRFLLPLLEPRIDAAAASGHQENFKSLLQQWSQQALGLTPLYSIIGQRGPDHAKQFSVTVQVGERTFEACWGNSKKLAEQQAALVALCAMGLAEQVAPGVVELRSGLSADADNTADITADGSDGTADQPSGEGQNEPIAARAEDPIAARDDLVSESTAPLVAPITSIDSPPADHTSHNGTISHNGVGGPARPAESAASNLL